VASLFIAAQRQRLNHAFSAGPPARFACALARDNGASRTGRTDLIARALAYRLQEQRLGGLDPQLRRLLMSLAKPGAEPVRHLKIGSIIVREHEGKIHEVMVAPGGFYWSGQVYPSLSAIARKITDTNLNGPRYFRLSIGTGVDGLN
jgi:hypothetical protein